MQVEICHGLVGAQLWLEMSFFYYYCACICAHLYTVSCPFATHVNAQIHLGKKELCIYIYIFFHKQNFLSSVHCNQKQNCARLKGL